MIRRRPILATLLLLLGGAALLAAPKIGARKPEFVGKYEVVLSGEWTGDGQANVHPDDMTLNLKAVDGAGQKVKLKCDKLTLVQGRFNGEGTADGAPVTIRGRVEEPANGEAPRLLGLVIDSANRKYARFVGVRKGD